MHVVGTRMEGFAPEQLRMLPRLCRPSKESIRDASEAVLSEVCSAGLDVIPSMLSFLQSLFGWVIHSPGAMLCPPLLLPVISSLCIAYR